MNPDLPEGHIGSNPALPEGDPRWAGELPVHFAAVSNADDKDDELLAHCLIDDAVTS